jgi:hypothetical protein
MEFLIIENNPILAKKYNDIGINKIFIDLEILGKEDRQGHLNTVISKHHKVKDISSIKKELTKSELLVRINPININSKNEIYEVIEEGADIIMLPFFKTAEEVNIFIDFVGNKAKTNLLFETPQSLVRIDEILNIDGIDEIHIGLNDLHLGMGLNFMFELISGGIIDYIVNKIKDKKIPFGIGGIASLDNGKINGRHVLAQHVRLGSSKVILSRSFIDSLDFNIEKISKEIKSILELEKTYRNLSDSELNSICLEFNSLVKIISKQLS